MARISALAPLPEADIDGSELVPVVKGAQTRNAPIDFLGRRAALAAEAARDVAIARAVDYASLADAQAQSVDGEVFAYNDDDGLPVYARNAAGVVSPIDAPWFDGGRIGINPATGASPLAIARSLSSWIWAQPLLISSYAPDGHVFGVSDDGPILQAAHDDAELQGLPLDLERLKLRINSTVYLGSGHFKGVGAVIECVLDDNFTQLGTATRRINGAILTKASPNAGYGVDTVAISFDELHFRTIRQAEAGDLNVGPLFERTSALAGQRLIGYAKHQGASATECTPLDFYREVRGVRIGTIEIEVRNGIHQLGGFWMRNLSAQVTAGDWRIGRILAKGTTRDELVAFYSVPGLVADINEVEIGAINVIHQAGGSGQCLSFLDNNGFFAGRMRNVFVNSIYCRIEGIDPSNGTTFGLKFETCAPEINYAKVEYTGTWGGAAMTSVFGIRSITAAGQVRLPYIGKAEVEMNAANDAATGSCDAFSGNMNIGTAILKGIGTGWKNGINGVKRLPDVIVEGDTVSGIAVRNADYVRGTVRGRMEYVFDFEGTHLINQEHLGTIAGWFLVNSDARPAAINYKAKVVVVSNDGGSLGNLVYLAVGGGPIVPASINYTLDIPASIAVGADLYTSFTAPQGAFSQRNASGFVTEGLMLPKTMTPAGTTGGQTIHKPAGSINMAAGQTSVVVTCNRAKLSSLIIPSVLTDGTGIGQLSVTRANGSFTITAAAAPTAETAIGFLIYT